MSNTSNNRLLAAIGHFQESAAAAVDHIEELQTETWKLRTEVIAFKQGAPRDQNTIQYCAGAAETAEQVANLEGRVAAAMAQCQATVSSVQKELNDARAGNQRLVAERDAAREESAKLREWAALSDQAMRLRCGELTAGELRAVRAVLRSITGG